MAVIYLRHPDHGAKVAISEMEAENDMQNGWEEFDPADLTSVATDVEDVVDSEPKSVSEPLADSVNELQPRRRGRRPREVAL